MPQERWVKSSSQVYAADPAHLFRKPPRDEAAVTIFVPCVSPPRDADTRRRASDWLGWGTSINRLHLVKQGGAQNPNWVLLLEEGEIHAGQIKTTEIHWKISLIAKEGNESWKN